MVKSIGAKITGIAVVAILVVSAYISWSSYAVQKNHISDTLDMASRMVLEFDLAFRDYVGEQIRPRMYDLLGEEEFVPELMSSSFMVHAVFEKLRDKFPRYILKFSTDNPRNQRNLAGAEELSILKYFRENPGNEEWSGPIEIAGQRYYGRFRARRVEAGCLKCHGDPEDAPDQLVERYGAVSGFGWKEGDVMAADTVAIPLDEFSYPMIADTRKHFLLLLASLVVCLGAIVLSLKVLVVDRLGRITAHISAAADRGEFSRIETVELGGEDEISLLASSFNVLAGKLKRYYGSMEDEVRMRIMRYETANEKLKIEVEKHRNTEIALKESESKLKQASDFYRTVLDSMKDPVAIIDAASRHIVEVNSCFTQFYGKPEGEVLGRPCREVLKDSSESCRGADAECPLEETLRTRGHSVREQVHCAAGQRRASVEVSTSPIYGPGGGVERLVMVVRDITEHKESETVKEEARRAAEEASRAKSHFLANMSHEVRTPLNGIIGLVELAMDTCVDEEQRRLFATMSSEASALLTMVDDVLDFSKIEARKLELQKIPFSVSHLVEELSNSIALQAEKKGLEFNFYLAPDLPHRVVGDPGRVRQVLLNLATNALKFTEEGEIFLRVELQEDLGDQVALRFSLKDTGIGVATDKQETIFESFTQADDSTTRRYGGTGLGLPIALQLVQLMGGSLSLESTPKRGSTFRAVAVFRKTEDRQAPTPREDVVLRGKRILVVDDSRTSISVIRSYLGLWGCRSVEAGSGEEALDLLASRDEGSEGFDLVIADFRMRGMDGFTLAERILSRPGQSSLPIILMTSRGSLGDGQRCREIGIRGYLTKPIGQDELRRAITAVLGSPPGEPEAEIVLVSRHSIAEEREGKALRVLVAEDYPTIQNILLMHLRGEGHDVDLAEDGAQAVEAFRQKKYDMVFMDIQMPVMDGFQATKAIRALERDRRGAGAPDSPPHVPIIAITAHTSEEDRRKCLDVGMDDFLPKPVKRATLLEMVGSWTGGETEGREETGTASPPGESDASPIDLSEVLGEFQGREKLLAESLQRFLADVESQSERIRVGLARGETTVGVEEAHSIKGAARFLTAEPLALAAFELEKRCREKDTLKAGEALARMEAEAARLRRFIAREQGGR